jgi:hypothetical protein
MKHRVVVGIDYAGKRAEPGAIVDDIPASSVTWLVEQGIIEPTTELPNQDAPKPTKSREPQSPNKGDK